MKIAYHFKVSKNLKLNQRKQLTDTNTELTLILELSDKVFKAGIVKVPQQEITNMFETNKRKIQPQQRNRRYEEEPNRNFRTEHKITETKNSMCALNKSMERGK